MVSSVVRSRTVIRDKVILDIYTIDNIGPECARLTKILRDDVCFYSS